MTYSYRFISDHRALFGVAWLCRVLNIRRQGFYEWLTAASTRAARTTQDEKLATQIAEIHATHHAAYGSPRVNHRRVERIMREHRIIGRTRRRARSLTTRDTRGGHPRCRGRPGLVLRPPDDAGTGSKLCLAAVKVGNGAGGVSVANGRFKDVDPCTVAETLAAVIATKTK